MFKEFAEIFNALKRTAFLLEKREKANLAWAAVIMLIVGFLTNLPALILGNFVDRIIETENSGFEIAVPFLLLIIFIILLKESLTVIRKYIVENVATQTEKKQTVNVINHLLHTDIDAFLGKYQIGVLHGRILRSIQGLVRIIKLGFL